MTIKMIYMASVNAIAILTGLIEIMFGIYDVT